METKSTGTSSPKSHGSAESLFNPQSIVPAGGLAGPAAQQLEESKSRGAKRKKNKKTKIEIAKVEDVALNGILDQPPIVDPL